jgi:hypothetical protein
VLSHSDRGAQHPARFLRTSALRHRMVRSTPDMPDAIGQRDVKCRGRGSGGSAYFSSFAPLTRKFPLNEFVAHLEIDEIRKHHDEHDYDRDHAGVAHHQVGWRFSLPLDHYKLDVA